MTDLHKYVQAQSFILSGSGLSLSDDSFVVDNFTTPDGAELEMNDFGDIGFGVLEANSVREEIISFTGITNNMDNTSTLTGVTRGLNFRAPYDADPSRARSHAGGSSFIITNAAPFYDKFANKSNSETIEGEWEFDQIPTITGASAPTSSRQLVNKEYVDNAATGSATYDQQIITQIAGETLAVGEWVYFKASDQRWYKTDATAEASSFNVLIGVVQTPATVGNDVNVLTNGLVKNQTGLTPGTQYYLSNTAGEISDTPGAVSVEVGVAETATQIFLNVSEKELTQDQIDALDNPTSGTPLSSTNVVVDEADVSSTAETDKIVRADGTALPALDGSSLTGVTIKMNATAGEAIDGSTVPKSVVIAPSVTQSVTGGNSTTDNTWNTLWYSQSFTTPSNSFVGLSGVKIRVRSGGGTNPYVTTLRCQIRTNSGGAPSGTILGSSEVNISIFNLVQQEPVFVFNTPVELSPSTVYHWVVYIDGPTNGTHFRIRGLNSAGQGAHNSSTSGASWTAQNGPLFHDVTITTHEAGKIYLTNATLNDTRANNFIGFVDSSLSKEDVGIVKVGGVVGGFTGLTPGAKYYLTNTAGAIGTSPGSQSRKIGNAISATEIIIISDNV